MKIRITTRRLPHRAFGAELDVSPEKAASLIGQGFAERLEADDAKETPRRPRRAKTRGTGDGV